MPLELPVLTYPFKKSRPPDHQLGRRPSSFESLGGTSPFSIQGAVQAQGSQADANAFKLREAFGRSNQVLTNAKKPQSKILRYDSRAKEKKFIFSCDLMRSNQKRRRRKQFKVVTRFPHLLLRTRRSRYQLENQRGICTSSRRCWIKLSRIIQWRRPPETSFESLTLWSLTG